MLLTCHGALHGRCLLHYFFYPWSKSYLTMPGQLNPTCSQGIIPSARVGVGSIHIERVDFCMNSQAKSAIFDYTLPSIPL